jgi:DNA-directed RNA polymerase subunit F
MEIKSSRAVSVSEAKEILAKRKEDGELGYEQAQALDNTEKFAKIDEEKVRKLVEGLMKIGNISHEMAIKIIDIRPDNPATLRAILVKDRVELSDDEISKVLKELA